MESSENKIEECKSGADGADAGCGPARYERQVNYYETDQMGIVHHTNYLRYFEEARLDCMKRRGCDALELERRGIIIPNVDAYAKYLRLLRFEDRFSVIVKPANFTGVRMKFEYEVIKDNGELCCTGFTTHCLVGADMKPLILKHTHPDVYERLTALFAN